MNDFKLLLFDLDGTLVDSEAAIVKTYQLALKKVKLPPVNPTQIKNLIGTSLPKILQTTHPEITEEQLTIANQTYVDIFAKETFKDVKLFEYVLDVLAKLKEQNFLMSIVSNKGSAAIRSIIKELEIAQFFDYAFGHDDMIEPKPSGKVIDQVLQKYSEINKNQTLMVGDTDNDILAAQNAGIKSVLINWGKNKNITAEFDYKIETLADLLPILYPSVN